MNNLFKSVGIWMVVALVLMTVFNQFNARQQSTAQVQLDYSQFLEEAPPPSSRLTLFPKKKHSLVSSELLTSLTVAPPTSLLK